MAETPLLTRAESGLRPPRSVTRLASPEGLTAHYWGDSPWPASADRSSPARFAATTDHNRCASLWRAAQSYHMSPGWGGTINGGADVAYSSGVCPHGVRHEGRGPGVRTGAQGTNAGNSRSLATVYFAGGDDPLTDAAKLAFLDEARRLGNWSRPRWQHGDWKATACAGPSIRAWKAAGWTRPGTAPTPPTTRPVLPPTSGGLTMSDITTILNRLDRLERLGARKAIAVRDPRDKKVWIVCPDGTRRHLPNPGNKAVALLVFLGVLQPGGIGNVHPISAEHLDLIPTA